MTTAGGDNDNHDAGRKDKRSNDSSLFQRWSSILTTPRGQAIAAMAVASALHFSAYEVSRSAITAMFTSSRSGFSSSPTALAAATGAISPFSVCLLQGYAFLLEWGGPRLALRYSTLSCAGVLLMGGIALAAIDPFLDNNHLNDDSQEQQQQQQQQQGEADGESSMIFLYASRVILFFLYMSQNGFVQLLYTQQWAFLGSVHKGKGSSAAWFAPVAGFGSVASTLAAKSVSKLAHTLTLPGLQMLAALMLVICTVCSETAYSIATKNGFDPHDEGKKATNSKKKEGLGSTDSILTKARKLFVRQPVLEALCIEVLVCQCLSSLLQFVFLWKTKDSIVDDEVRAGWTGNCYAIINGASGILQVLVIPIVAKRVDLRKYWTVMPTIILAGTIWMIVDQSCSLMVVAPTFMAMKTIEFSIRGVSNEMLYASLDYESRFLGKEVIGLFANRFGKSIMAVGLSVYTAQGNNKGLDNYLPLVSGLFALMWFGASYRLTQRIPAPVLADSGTTNPDDKDKKE